MAPSSSAGTAGTTKTAVPQAAPALWLVRHGESTWNAGGLVQGHNDEAVLTERGLRQAAEAAARFRGQPVRALYASDLRRAQQTAAVFAELLHVPVHSDARLRERSLGVLEGQLHATMNPSVYGFADGLVIDPEVKPSAGESLRDLYQRAAAFIDELAASLSPAPFGSVGDVVVVAHGGTVRVLDAYLHGVPVDQMTWRPVDNATIVRIPAFGSFPRGGNR
jgi:2,3-bisphosphoglycerate-dependent phosphoglycerate mutase